MKPGAIDMTRQCALFIYFYRIVIGGGEHARHFLALAFAKQYCVMRDRS